MFIDNEDEVLSDSTEEVEDNEESHDDDSTAEGDDAEVSENENERKPETPEAKRARLTRQLAQLDKKHPKEGDTETERDSKEDSNKANKEVDHKYEKLELKMEGIKSKKEQDAIIEYAEWKGLEVIDAMNSPAMKAELKEMRNKNATPASSTRTSGGARGDDPASLARRYVAGKPLDTAAQRIQAREFLAKNPNFK